MPRLHLPLLALSLFLCALACAVGSLGRGVERQQWDDQRGPVVPHDTFPADCALCHEGSSWQRVREDFSFDHLAETGVALQGAHDEAECLRCHNDRGPVERFASRGCVGCHDDVHQGKLGKGCGDCHDADRATWEVREPIALHQKTRFPLVGAHVTTACFECHPGAQVGNFQRTDTRCTSCHQDDLLLATSPDHQAQGWVDDCQDCHIPTTWGGGGFNHAAFPLNGAHAALACDACHAGGVFQGTPSACVACHQREYDATANPDHGLAGFPTTCETCHNTTAWQPATFDHSSFPLTGAHAQQSCNACHANGVFEGTPDECVACHLDDYQNADDPDHEAKNFPTDCRLCHNTVDWGDASFSHQGVTQGCVQCHLKDYNGATDPNHAALGLPTTCEQCHTSTSDWNQATFSHRGIAQACAACHLADYNAATDPNHAAAGFPTTCETCHDTVDWDNGQFVHDFPITGGAEHAGLACGDCHLNPGNFGVFSCITCHEHNARDMNDEHRGVSGYAYSSQACYTCHPDGEEHASGGGKRRRRR